MDPSIRPTLPLGVRRSVRGGSASCAVEGDAVESGSVGTGSVGTGSVQTGCIQTGIREAEARDGGSEARIGEGEDGSLGSARDCGRCCERGVPEHGTDHAVHHARVANDFPYGGS